MSPLNAHDFFSCHAIKCLFTNKQDRSTYYQGVRHVQWRTMGALFVIVLLLDELFQLGVFLAMRSEI